MALSARVAMDRVRSFWFAQSRNLAFVCLGLAGLGFNGMVAVANSSTWDVDFNQYYAAGKLAGTGRLYDWDSIQSLQLEQNARTVPFGRVPAFALAFKPLSAIPYSISRILWLCAGISALAGFVTLWPLASRAWACVAICWSAPVAMCLAFGQDSVLFLFCVALGLRLLLRKREFWAGVAFSLCASKPHLALLLPVFLAARLKWNAILGGLAGGLAIALLSFAVEGPRWPERLLSLARLPEFDPAADRMPNLRGLLSFLGNGLFLEIALAVVVIAVVWLLSRRLVFPAGAALALAGGLLLSHHAYFYDALLLLPALLLPYQAPYPQWMRDWALILITPVAYLLLLTNAALPGNLAITGYTVALMAAMAYGLRRDPELNAAIWSAKGTTE